jgi:collagen type III alpha
MKLVLLTTLERKKMKRILVGITALAAFMMIAGTCAAQPPGGRGLGRGGPGPFGPPPKHPLISLLDENEDGALSMEEIDKAIAKLKKLDKDSNGKVTLEELPRPAMGPPTGEPRGRGFGGRGQGGPPPRGGAGAFMERMQGMDKNEDGKITKDELPERMQNMFSRLDTDGDGSLDKKELESMATRMRGRGQPAGPGAGQGGGRPRAGAEGGLMQRFTSMDKDGDGKLSKEEMPERMQAMFDRLDANSDGAVDKEEFGAMAERLRGARPRGNQ